MNSSSTISRVDQFLIDRCGPSQMNRRLMDPTGKDYNERHVEWVKNYSWSNAKSKAFETCKFAVLIIGTVATVVVGYVFVRSLQLGGANILTKGIASGAAATVTIVAMVFIGKNINPYSPKHLADQAVAAIRNKTAGDLVYIRQGGCDERVIQTAIRCCSQETMQFLLDQRLLQWKHVSYARSCKQLNTFLLVYYPKFKGDNWDEAYLYFISLNRFFAAYLNPMSTLEDSEKAQFQQLLVFLIKSHKLTNFTDQIKNKYSSGNFHNLFQTVDRMKDDSGVDPENPESYRSYFEILAKIGFSYEDCEALIDPTVLPKECA